MNVRRVAALLRELADAIEQDDPATKQRPRKRPVVASKGPPPSPEAVERMDRILRSKGLK